MKNRLISLARIVAKNLPALFKGGFNELPEDKWMLLAGILRDYFPDSRFKQSLISYIYRSHNPLNGLDRIIKEAGLSEDGLLVELNGGEKFLAWREEGTVDYARYTKSEKLRNVKGIEHFTNFLGVLREIYLQEVYERYYEIKRGDIVIDAGSWVGMFTVKAAKAVGEEGMVIAIEPCRQLLPLLQRNIRMNAVENRVKIVNKALWSKRELAQFYYPRDLGPGYAAIKGSRDAVLEGSLETHVQADTLDNILGELGIRKVDFIKMDIEGAEIEALKGMDETLKNDDVKLAIAAYHTTSEKKKTYKFVAPELKRKGFKVHVEHEMVYARKRIKS